MDEHELLAAFLYNFTKFVEWPPEAFPATDSAFRICLVDADDVGSVLEALVAREAVKGRRLEVARHRRIQDATECQILFLAEEAEPDALSRLPGAHEAPILTVGESEEFLRAGGMIRLRVRAGRSRIQVNEPVRQRSPLKLSSKLLQLSDLVRLAPGRES